MYFLTKMKIYINKTEEKKSNLNLGKKVKIPQWHEQLKCICFYNSSNM